VLNSASTSTASPEQRGQTAADRGESRTDNPFDKHMELASHIQWDEGFVRRRKQRAPVQQEPTHQQETDL
jgi:hypothetical protein